MSIVEMSVTDDPEIIKKRLRTRMSAIRELIGAEGRAKADALIAQRLIAHPDYEAADALFTYISVRSEVDTRAIIRDAWSKGKMVAAPRCVKGTNRMEWYRIDSLDGLESGGLGVEEPPADPERLVEVPGPDSSTKAIAIVPGFTFDSHCYRLGYGGGYYDVFLPTFGGKSFGLCRTVQLDEERIPCNEHDVPVDVVVTDERLITR